MHKKYIPLLIFAFPLITYASYGLDQIVFDLIYILSIYVFRVIIGFAVLAFLWGIIQYLWKGSDEKKRIESKYFMLWGIVGIAVMASVWSLIAILANIFGMHIPGGMVPHLPIKQ